MGPTCLCTGADASPLDCELHGEFSPVGRSGPPGTGILLAALAGAAGLTALAAWVISLPR